MTLSSKRPPIHPGIHIRKSVLPGGLSVKEAAEMLGVGRPALSNLLNGRAALSPSMAVRLEKAFQADASALLEMQKRYQEFETRTHENDIVVRAYMPAFLQITARQITSWADDIKARSQLPALLRTLVHSTGSDLALVDFPAFENSERKGWDGQIMSGAATPWIPRGNSGWEFGCGKNPRAKAERDYRNRTAHIPARERQSITFVFVTPRNWVGKHNWASAKKSREEWKDVRAYDASDLEQWLEQSIPAQIRMREFRDGGAGQDVMTLGQIWREWAGVTEPELPRELFAPAVAQHREKIEKWLKAVPANPLVVTADSLLEGLAFLSCLLERLKETCPGAWERAVVIRSLEAFKAIFRRASNWIMVVASPEVERNLSGLQKKTHTIIVRSRNTVTDKADIALGLLDHESFRKALIEAGLGDFRIEQLARESARSPTTLRRRLATVPAVKEPPWATDPTVARKMIPLIFVGAWDSNAESDKEILHCLTHNPYEAMEQMIAELQAMEEPPVWSISHFRGVASKVDALYAAQRILTKEELKNFLFAAEVVLSEQDPALDLPEDKQWAAELYGKSRDHSPALRQGICDSLVLLAVHGNALVGDRLGINLECRIGKVVRCLLTPSAASTWLSQKDDLPQYAEATPDIFLEIIEVDLKSEDPRIRALFAPAAPGIFGNCPRSGMLWALELLAWKSERLVRVASILARLCSWAINDNWANTPMASLKSIFRFWMPQTAASTRQRNQALGWLTKKFPGVAWQICIDQFNPGRSVGDLNAKPRWRADAYETQEVATNGDLRDGQQKAIELALEWPSHDERTLGDLVDRLEVLCAENRKKVWELIVAWNGTEPTDTRKSALRERIRRCALTRRGWQRTGWRRTFASERKQARQVYELLKPRNPVTRHQELFMNQWVHESTDKPEHEQLDWKEREVRVACQRRNALQEVWVQSGLEGVRGLCRSSDAPQVVGWHMAEICTGVQRAVDFLRDILTEPSDDLRDQWEQCIFGFLAKLELQDRDAVLTELLAHFEPDEDACVRLLCCAPFDSNTWKQVNRLSERLKSRYWKEVSPRWSSHNASEIAIFVDELLKVNRPHAAFLAARMDCKLIDSPRLMRLLKDVATNNPKPPDSNQLNGHYVSETLNTLAQRGDAACKELAQLEFLFIRVLDDFGHGIPHLEALLSKSPALFMEALAYAFKRDDGGEDPAEWQPENSENRSAFVYACYQLLDRASRIPGTQDDGSIDFELLRAWLNEVRTLTRRYGRVSIGDQKIGQLLSHCPQGNDGVWPCESVREVLDDIGSQEIAHGMEIGIHNTRGVTVRNKGGSQERELAEQFRNWSRAVAFEHPFTAAMLEGIASSYDQEATWWDNQNHVLQRLEP